GVQRLPGVVDGSLSRSDAGPVLFHRELGLADFDTDAVLSLLQGHLGLPVFEFTADLNRLGSAVPQWNVKLQADAFVGCGRVNQLAQRAAIPGCSDRGRSTAESISIIGAKVRRILRTPQSRASVVSVSVKRRQKGTTQRLVADLLTVQLNASFDELR